MANRGEIALRVLRAAGAWHSTMAIEFPADAGQRHTSAAPLAESLHRPPLA
ncbi:MAG: hypothetical protein U5L46_16305 [Agrobacterium sp.]|nr:hypothetical protein [Agrobacterium sp.]